VGGRRVNNAHWKSLGKQAQAGDFPTNTETETETVAQLDAHLVR